MGELGGGSALTGDNFTAVCRWVNGRGFVVTPLLPGFSRLGNHSPTPVYACTPLSLLGDSIGTCQDPIVSLPTVSHGSCLPPIHGGFHFHLIPN